MPRREVNYHCGCGEIMDGEPAAMEHVSNTGHHVEVKGMIAPDEQDGGWLQAKLLARDRATKKDHDRIMARHES